MWNGHDYIRLGCVMRYIWLGCLMCVGNKVLYLKHGVDCACLELRTVRGTVQIIEKSLQENFMEE